MSRRTGVPRALIPHGRRGARPGGGVAFVETQGRHCFTQLSRKEMAGIGVDAGVSERVLRACAKHGECSRLPRPAVDPRPAAWLRSRHSG